MGELLWGTVDDPFGQNVNNERARKVQDKEAYLYLNVIPISDSEGRVRCVLNEHQTWNSVM